jgi:hypothetical protein
VVAALEIAVLVQVAQVVAVLEVVLELLTQQTAQHLLVAVAEVVGQVQRQQEVRLATAALAS